MSNDYTARKVIGEGEGEASHTNCMTASEQGSLTLPLRSTMPSYVVLVPVLRLLMTSFESTEHNKGDQYIDESGSRSIRGNQS